MCAGCYTSDDCGVVDFYVNLRRWFDCSSRGGSKDSCCVTTIRSLKDELVIRSVDIRLKLLYFSPCA